MLTLTRAPGHAIRIGEQITVTVLRVHGDKVRIGIEAPREISISRGGVAVSTPKEKAAPRRPE